MSNVYEVKTNQAINKGTGSQTYTEFHYTESAIWDGNTLNTPWNDNGCYAGANAGNGSLMGSGSITSFSGWNEDTGKSDMRNFSTEPTYYSGTQNLRFMIDFGSAGRTLNKKTFNWTGLTSELKSSIENAFSDRNNLNNPVSVYSPYTRANYNSSVSGPSNSPLNIAPLNSLKINNLVWLPSFLIKEIEYYDYNAEAGGYKSNATNQGTWYTWSSIKPEDKTPAGENYDEELYTQGYKEITPTHEDGVRFQYVAGVVLTPYYGNCSNTYNPNTDSYTPGSNPDDGFVYGDRTIFGTLASDSGTYPIVGNHATNRPLLYVCNEIYNNMTESITYQTPTGILFANIMPPTTISAEFNIQPNWSFTANAQLLSVGGISSYYTNFWNTNNDSYNGIFKGVGDPTTQSVNPDFYTAGSICKVNAGWISQAMSDSSYPSAGHYYLQDNTPMAFRFTKSNRTIANQSCSYFSIDSLWATIANLGCYVADSATCARSAPTGKYVGNNNHLYLGEMASNGITTGKMIQGSDISNQPQSNIDDIIQNTPYNPVIPTPGGGGGGTDPSNPPTPSGKGEPKITGDSTTGHKERFFGGGGIRYYALNASEMDNFRNILWSQPNSFFERLNIASKNNTSIFNFISSVRYYPTNLATLTTIGAAAPVYLGSGAKFTTPNGEDYLLNTLSGFFGQVDWCHWNMSSFPGWRNNFLDYSPYSKLSIYLPYAGTFDLDIQTCASMTDITDATIYVRACIDLNTGSMTYFVDADGILILEHTCKLGVDFPLTGNDSIRQAVGILDTNYKSAQRLLGDGVNVANSVKSKDGLTTVTNSINTGLNIADSYIQNSLAQRQIPTAVSGFGGTMSTITQGQNPYLTLYRQKIANPENYGHSIGYLTCSTHTVSSLSGFTVCENVDATSIPATSAEQEMIKNIMENGFYA